ncbi:MAG: hypothetical protein ABSH38_09900 [Verrucomicrobiota bacterium]|jgi:hypothetical protein
MRDNAVRAGLLWLRWLPVSLAVAAAPGEAPAAALPDSASGGSVLEFVDGSALHGQLERMDLEHGLCWVCAPARSAIHFQPAHVDVIRFAHADQVNLAPKCHLRFANGDDLFGAISSLEGGQLGFSTWFGGTMSIPKAAVRTITFLSRNYRIVYEGPYDGNGWVIGNNAPQSWSYRDGCFIGAGSGTLGRDLSLTNSSTVEFDLAWNGSYLLLVNVYSRPLDHLEYNSGSYVVEFSPKQVTLRHVHSGGLPRSFGGAPLPVDGDKNKFHATIQCNKDEGTVAVFINNLLVKSWKDEDGFHGSGSGLLFEEGSAPGTTVKLSNLKVAQWEGRYEPDTTLAATNGDAIHFVNHDRAGGKIAGIKDGKVTLALEGTVLEVPLERVTQISFAEGSAPAEPSGPWDVRAYFPGGGNLSFQLEKWDDKMISGRSAIFGPLAFQPGAIRQMEFNLNRSKDDAAAVAGKDFEELDE